jgi:histidinol-phosphate/aromatic aminotransferase/cobyric acid decarboxylase-like protein
MTAAPLPGAHGGDGAALAAALGVPPAAVLDLSLSLNPAAPEVVELVAEHADAVRSYPDPAPARQALADAMGIDPARLLITNGGSEAIALVAAEHPVGWVEAPDFSLYARSLAHLDASGPRWRSNPNNPTGQLADGAARAAVWDEAFYPLATGRWTRGDADAIVIGSLTKLFGCPGLRAGYVLAPDGALIHRLAARQPEWSVNGIACAVLPTLTREADLRGWSARIAVDRARLVALLEAAGLAPEPSDANYLFVPRADGLRERLARHAVLVRDTTSFGFPGGVRVAVPDARGLDRFASALSGWTASPAPVPS